MEKEICESCVRGDHENCVGEETVHEGGYTNCCCDATDPEPGDDAPDVSEVQDLDSSNN